jgi:Glycosyltransferase 61
MSNANTTSTRDRVKIISEETPPPVGPISVAVHYLESGIQKTITVQMKLPTYFDSIVVSIVPEILPSLSKPQIGLSSLRDMARFGYHTARNFEASILPPLVMRRPIFDTRSWEPNNMAHLLLDLIPYSLYARRAVGPEVGILFRKLGKRFCQLLEIFGIIPIFERRRVEADVVNIRGTRGLAVYDLKLPHTFDCFGISFVPDVYSEMDFSSSTKWERVFLARRGPRSLINGSEVEEIVARFGYRTVFMEDYSLLEQLSIGAQAKHVVAIHGAAMSFLIMSRRIDSIIELLPQNNYAAGFPVALGSRVREYVQIIPSFDRNVQHVGWPAIVGFKDLPFAVDTSLLGKLLSSIH